MKSKIGYFIIFILFLGFVTVLLNFDNNKSSKIKVAEVARTVFYAPQYIAIENDYFKEFGLDIELILMPGVDNKSDSL